MCLQVYILLAELLTLMRSSCAIIYASQDRNIFFNYDVSKLLLIKKYLLNKIMKNITEFLKLLKNTNYRKKIEKIEKNIYKCTKVFNFA